MKSFFNFFESPTNRSGLSIWFGTALTAFVQYFVLHITLPSADILGIILGFVKIIQPENSVTVGQLQKSISDLSEMLLMRNSASVAAVVADTEAIVSNVIQDTQKNDINLGAYYEYN
jgi:hypothetical protein